MSLAIACWVRDIAIINTQKDVELSKALLSSMSKSKTILNTSIHGMSANKEIIDDSSKKMYRDLAWVFKG